MQHIDQLKTPLGTIDIGLIRDEANDLALRTGPRPKLPPLGENQVDTVAHDRTRKEKDSLTQMKKEGKIAR